LSGEVAKTDTCQLRGYTSKHGGKTHFGGHQYDITRKTAAERKRHSLEYVITSMIIRVGD
jgi:hypothetical protein